MKVTANASRYSELFYQSGDYRLEVQVAIADVKSNHASRRQQRHVAVERLTSEEMYRDGIRAERVENENVIAAGTRFPKSQPGVSEHDSHRRGTVAEKGEEPRIEGDLREYRV